MLTGRDTAVVALTGGGIGTRILMEMRASPLRDIVDWPRVRFWWGDDRYVPVSDSDRNELQARSALLDHLDLVSDQLVVMPPAGLYDSVAAAADRMNAILGHNRPDFDVVLLGVGQDGHVASIFPDRPDLLDATTPVVAVTDSPKPPSERISLSLPTICSARSVWLVAAGSEKAAAIAEARQPGSALPAGRVAGTAETLWLVDEAAAGMAAVS